MGFKILISQLLAVIAFIFFFISMQLNKKKKVLLFQIIANIFFSLQYILLKLWSAVSMDILTIIRCYVFYRYSNKKVPKKVFIIFIILTILLGVFTYNGLVSIIPVIIALLYTYGLYEKKLFKFRLSCLFAALLWIIFNLLSGAYIAVVGNFIELFGAILAIIKHDIKKEKNYAEV